MNKKSVWEAKEVTFASLELYWNRGYIQNEKECQITPCFIHKKFSSVVKCIYSFSQLPLVSFEKSKEDQKCWSPSLLSDSMTTKGWLTKELN